MRQIKQIIHRLFRYDQRMARIDRFNIQKSDKIFIFVNFMRRNFAFDDFSENGVGHNLDKKNQPFFISSTTTIFLLSMMSYKKRSVISILYSYSFFESRVYLTGIRSSI